MLSIFVKFPITNDQVSLEALKADTEHFQFAILFIVIHWSMLQSAPVLAERMTHPLDLNNESGHSVFLMTLGTFSGGTCGYRTTAWPLNAAMGPNWYIWSCGVFCYGLWACHNKQQQCDHFISLSLRHHLGSGREHPQGYTAVPIQFPPNHYNGSK